MQSRNQIERLCLCVIVLRIWFLGLSLRSDQERKGKSKSYVAGLNERRPRRLCNQDCDSMDGNRPKATAQRMPNCKLQKQDWGDQPLFDQSDLYVIPEALIYEIFGGILSSMPSSSE